MADQLLKRWSSWQDGIGHVLDDGKTNGMYKASGLLGLRGELRVAPKLNPSNLALDRAYSSWSFNADPLGVTAAITINPASASTVSPIGTDSSGSGPGANLTFAHTVPAYVNGALYVVVMTDNSVTPSAVTFNGDSLTLYFGYVSAANRITFWRRVAPDVATGNVVVTCAATDIMAYAATFSGVNQGTPELSGAGLTVTGLASPSGPTLIRLTGAVGAMMLDAVSVSTAVTDCIPDARQSQLLDTTTNNLRGSVSRKPISVVNEMSIQYAFEAEAALNSGSRYLYVVGSTRQGGLVEMWKIMLNAPASNFGQDGGGANREFALQYPIFAGQIAKYQGIFYIPIGNDSRSIALTVVADSIISSDTFVATASPFVPGADHLISFGNQMAGVVRQGVAGRKGWGGIGVQKGGVRILKVDGVAATAADWGPFFPAGDATDRAGGLINLGGATFVLQPDGLYSFNAATRSGFVFPDLGEWQNTHRNILWTTWRGGIVMPHPSGLLYIVPGQRPEPIGLSGGNDVLPPLGVENIFGGYWHSVTPIGDFIYGVYQPNPTTTEAWLMVGYGKENITWQVLETITLADHALETGVFVARNGFPVNSGFVTPAVFVQDGPNLGWITLDGSGGPFRGRADTHVVQSSADAFLSELEFEEPFDLSRIVVYTSPDRAAGDEWQISLIADGVDGEKGVGAPIRSGGIRHVLPVSRRAVQRVMLHVVFSGTSTAARVPPAIRRIDLFGVPTTGESK